MSKPVEEMSLEELEAMVAIRKHEARMVEIRELDKIEATIIELSLRKKQLAGRCRIHYSHPSIELIERVWQEQHQRFLKNDGHSVNVAEMARATGIDYNLLLTWAVTYAKDRISSSRNGCGQVSDG